MDAMELSSLYHNIMVDPPKGRAFWIRADDGVRLRVGLWESARGDRGSILLFPGRSDYMELYGHSFADLVRAGYSVLSVDWRGHGLSDRLAPDPTVGHVDRFSDYQKDVLAMIKAAETFDLPMPWFLIGHSMGATIGLRALMNGLQVSACAFTAPMWDLHLSPLQRVLALPLSWAAQAIGKGRSFAPGYTGESYVSRVRFPANRLTNSSDMYEFWINQGRVVPDLHIGGPSMGWLYQALGECRNLSTMPSPDIPCIAFCGDQEEVVSIPAIEDRMARWPLGSLELIPKAKHELLLEVPGVREHVLIRTCKHFDRSVQR